MNSSIILLESSVRSELHHVCASCSVDTDLGFILSCVQYYEEIMGYACYMKCLMQSKLTSHLVANVWNQNYLFLVRLSMDFDCSSQRSMSFILFKLTTVKPDGRVLMLWSPFYSCSDCIMHAIRSQVLYVTLHSTLTDGNLCT